MKIAICYVLMGREKPLLSQNRQFQWYTGEYSYAVYPVVMASAATVLKKAGHKVFWMDYIAENKSYGQFEKDFLNLKPDLAVFESKTPVIKKHWEIINKLKRLCPKTKFVLCGDHVTALPEESLRNSRGDFILRGGDYDFLLSYLSDLGGLSKMKIIKTKGGDLNKLPMIDRELTKWWLYSKNNGNYRYTPGAYTMAGRDCWWRRKQLPITNYQLPMKHQSPISNIQIGGCAFCSWASLYPEWRVVKPEKLLNEIGRLIDMGVREVFDDTGTFPVGDWLSKFCLGMIKRGYNKKIYFGCNMRAGVLKQKDYNLMKRANFRFILFGMESANNETLKKINKGLTIEQITADLKMAKKAGLSPHATVMFGYPWETYEMAKKTVELAKKLFNEGVIDSLQATIVIPYPGTALFEECKNKKLLRTVDWDKYDMRMAIMKCPIPDEKLFGLVRECYLTVLSPSFLIRQIGQIRNIGDIKYLGFLGVKFLSKLGDFKNNKNNKPMANSNFQ